MISFLDFSQQTAAVIMWQRGCDTHRIAERFEVSESYVYNHLERWRRRWKMVPEKGTAT